MSVWYVLPVVRNSYQPTWFVTYRRICIWRHAFRAGGCE